MPVTEEQAREFQSALLEFEKTHPDFRELLAKAQIRAADGSIDLPIAARDEIIRLRSPETLYTILTDPKEAVALHVAKGEPVNNERKADRVRRIHSRITRNQTYQTAGEPQGEEREVREYLAKRKRRR